jgi:hypothetical protein
MRIHEFVDDGLGHSSSVIDPPRFLHAHEQLAEQLGARLAWTVDTPDRHAYLLSEHGRPVALFTGGSLMDGTVGRTDLCGPDLAVQLAHPTPSCPTNR